MNVEDEVRAAREDGISGLSPEDLPVGTVVTARGHADRKYYVAAHGHDFKVLCGPVGERWVAFLTKPPGKAKQAYGEIWVFYSFDLTIVE